MIRFLTNDILTFHERFEKATGIRDLGLIESAVNAPFQTFGGEFLYPKVEEARGAIVLRLGQESRLYRRQQTRRFARSGAVPDASRFQAELFASRARLGHDESRGGQNVR